MTRWGQRGPQGSAPLSAPTPSPASAHPEGPSCFRSDGLKALWGHPSLPSPGKSKFYRQMFLLPGSHPGLCRPCTTVRWDHCSVDVGLALSREDGRAGGLQVLGELSEEGIREEVSCWVWDSGSLDSDSGSMNGLSVLLWNVGTLPVLVPRESGH